MTALERNARSAALLSGVLGAVGLLAGGVAYAALSPQSQIFGPVLVAGDDPWEIALTYDDGPNPAATPQLLDVLAGHCVRATFFLIGSFVRREPALARRIADAGHAVGCHSMTHPRLAWQTDQRVLAEIADSQAVVEQTTGRAVRLFRPPFGARRPLVMRAVQECGMTTVQWNVTCHDWKKISADAIVAHAAQGIARARRRGVGSNLLLHDGFHLQLGASRTQTVEVTQQLLAQYGSGKNRFVTVDAWVHERGLVS